MAKVNVTHITLKFRDGTTVNLDGQPADAVYSAYMGGACTIWYQNEDGNTESIERHCLCGIIKLPNTQDDIDDRECTDIPCIPEYGDQNGVGA